MPEPTKPASSRWVKIVLTISLGVNLLIIGTVIGLSFKDPPRRPPSPDAVAFLSFALPKEHRDALRQQLLSRRDELRANRMALADMRRQMVVALQAEPFEIAAVEEILQRQRQRFLALGELAHSALLERIAMLSPKERAAYVNALKKRKRSEPPDSAEIAPRSGT